MFFAKKFKFFLHQNFASKSKFYNLSRLFSGDMDPTNSDMPPVVLYETRNAPTQLASSLSETRDIKTPKIFGLKLIVKDTWTSVVTEIIPKYVYLTTTKKSVITTFTYTTTVYKSIEVEKIKYIPKGIMQCH